MATPLLHQAGHITPAQDFPEAPPPHPRGDAFARTTARLPCITSQTPDALPSRHIALAAGLELPMNTWHA